VADNRPSLDEAERELQRPLSTFRHGLVDDRDANLVAIEVNLPNSAFSLLPTIADAARMPLFLPKMVFI